jgi:hypothetical protein
MADPAFRSALLQRWQAEFGDRFTAAEYQSALDDVEMFRRCAQRLAEESVDLGEMPFPCLLPPIQERP